MITENIFIFRGDSFWSIYIYILARTSQDTVLSGFHPHRRTNILEKDQMKRIHSSVSFRNIGRSYPKYAALGKSHV